jgi:hypothetical protein
MNKRKHKRYQVRIRAFAYVGEKGHACDVLDVSEEGCRIACIRPVELPDLIELHVVGKPEPRRAWVRWRRGREAGLSFRQPQTP